MDRDDLRLFGYVVGVLSFAAVGVYGLVKHGDGSTLLALAGILGVGTNGMAAVNLSRQVRGNR